MHEALLDKFENGYMPVTESGCWLWIESLNRVKNGYGIIYHDLKCYRAHRVSWEIYNNMAVPEGLFVCHKCDVSSCVNPMHLYAGTALDNSRDMRSRHKQIEGHKWGRPFGSKNVSKKTHCIHGHKYTIENTIYKKSKNGLFARNCRLCKSIRDRK